MAQMNKIAAAIVILIIGSVVQVLFAFADCQNTPNRAAAEFSKAYFQLDRSMAKRICSQRLTSEKGVNLVDKYIYLAAQEAEARGFKTSFMQNKLYDIKTETLSETWTKAQIRITGKRRVAINPVYPIVTKLFNLGATYEIDETLDLVREGGQWKVCGKFFNFPMQ